MIKNFIKHFGFFNILMVLVIFSIIITSEYIFLQGRKLDAIFLGLWAPTILGFLIYFSKYKA